jgi:hypothetical protein
MATNVYDSSSSNSQSNETASAQLHAEFDALERALKSAQCAVRALRNRDKSLILQISSVPPNAFDLGARFKRLDRVDLVGELRGFLECACLGAAGLGVRNEGDGLQTVLSHVIFGLNLLSENLRSDLAEAPAA